MHFNKYINISFYIYILCFAQNANSTAIPHITGNYACPAF